MPFNEGGRYFYTRNSGLQNQSVLYTTDSLDGKPQVLARPQHALGRRHRRPGRAWRSATTAASWPMRWPTPAPTGSRGKCATSRPARICDDLVRWIKFSGASWTKDGQGLLLRPLSRAQAGRGPAGESTTSRSSTSTRSARRRRTTSWSTSGPTRRSGSSAASSPTTASTWSSPSPRAPTTAIGVLYQKLDAPNAPIVELIANFDADYELIDNDGPVFWFKTNKDAPRGRVIAIDTRQPGRGQLERAHSAGGRNACGQPPGRRPLLRHLPEGRAHAGQGLRPRPASFNAR